MDDLKHIFKDNYLKYASYVILERAIPDMIDGLKPVQRRILETLYQMDDGKLHKVANVAGQTMALHPHGDAAIIDALVNLANKGFLLDTQGNFGNLHTGDPAAAARYIETRLSPLAKETLFNPSLTTYLPSYDGRNQEPVSLPAKIPLLLMQGSEGIAVGMSTKILPHNFQELLEAQVDLLQGKEISILPDFPSGGIMDASEYADGAGKVKLRAKISVVDDKTLIIYEICYGTTTESVIRSIDEAAKKGKLKLESISDFTAEKVEIQIKLPRGQYAKQLLDSLYAFTDCEISLHSTLLSIKDKLPVEAPVTEILNSHVDNLLNYLKTELEIEQDHLLKKIFDKTLEQLFIENRLYKQIEEVTSYEKIHATIQKSLTPFHKQLARIPTQEDRERLLNIPIRRISRFDQKKNEEEIVAYENKLLEIEKNLKGIKRYTIKYLQALLKKYGKNFPRRTEIQEIKQLDIKAISKKDLKVSYDRNSGFLGTKVSSETSMECTNLDKLLIFYENGSYQVINVPEKQFVHTQDCPLVWLGVADKKTTFSVIYRDLKTNFPHAKRFIVKQFILDKLYRYFDPESHLEFISTRPHSKFIIKFKRKPKQKTTRIDFSIDEVSVKGVSAKGIRIANKELKSLKIKEAS